MSVRIQFFSPEELSSVRYFILTLNLTCLRYLNYYNLKLFLEPFIRMCFVLICRSSSHEFYFFQYL